MVTRKVNYSIWSENDLKEAPYHNDPFDRLLLAQAKADNMLFITHDKMFLGYDEPYLTLV